jgi:hypothetical protein
MIFFKKRFTGLILKIIVMANLLNRLFQFSLLIKKIIILEVKVRFKVPWSQMILINSIRGIKRKVVLTNSYKGEIYIKKGSKKNPLKKNNIIKIFKTGTQGQTASYKIHKIIKTKKSQK